MNGYARKNDDAESYAPLTSGLLARKGQASPAFDSDAYSEVMTGNEFTAPVSPIFEQSEGYAANPGDEPERLALQRRDQRPPAQPRERPRTAPRKPKGPAPKFRATPDGAHHASVAFRLPREELQRLRRAARELEMSCHQILLDAVECYLDANEVEPVRNEWADDVETEEILPEG